MEAGEVKETDPSTASVSEVDEVTRKVENISVSSTNKDAAETDSVKVAEVSVKAAAAVFSE